MSVCVNVVCMCVYSVTPCVCVSVCVLVHAPRQAAKASGQGWLLQEPKPGIHFQAPVILPSPYLSPSFSHCWQSVMQKQKQQQQIKCAAEASSVEPEHYFFFFFFLFVFHPYWVSFKKNVKKKKREEFWRGHARKYAWVCVWYMTIFICISVCVCVWESIKHTYLDFWCNML